MSTNPYETERLLAEYLLFHFGSADEILPASAPGGMRDALDFAVRTTRHFSLGTVARTLDLGCAVGRSTYELSRDSSETIGIAKLSQIKGRDIHPLVGCQDRIGHAIGDVTNMDG